MRFALTLLIVLVSVATAAADSIPSSFSYVPDIHGVFRGRWEADTQNGGSHFQVRNARVSIDGKVAPIIAYKFNADLCDRGKLMLLDAYATVTPLRGFDITVGQYRMPFGYESFRGPGAYYFNNRSYVGKTVNNYRAVGLEVAYTLPRLPLTAEAGIFNPTAMDDQTTWVRKYAYAGRLIYRPGSWLVVAGMESINPGAIRINLMSATLGWTWNNLYAEAEYMTRSYTHRSHKFTQAYNIFASYAIELPRGLFKQLSFQARFDGMTYLANGTATTPDGDALATTADGRHRLTIGSTLDYTYRRLRAAVRLNYEKCWYDHAAPGGTPRQVAQGAGDMLSAELIVKF